MRQKNILEMVLSICQRKVVNLMPPTGCSCKRCISACSNKPGWFLPGEVEKTAKFLDMTTQDFFDKYLAVDWFRDTFVLAPAIIESKPGGMYPLNPHGQCIFFKNNRCSIHAVKPFECRNYNHNKRTEESQATHELVAKEWEPHQVQIFQLYPLAKIQSEDC